MTASAQTLQRPPLPQALPRIAVVAFQVAVAQTNEGQRNFADVKRSSTQAGATQDSHDDIESLKKQLQTQGDKLSPAEQSAKTRRSTKRPRRCSATQKTPATTTRTASAICTLARFQGL